jgi:hypothetical protein
MTAAGRGIRRADAVREPQEEEKKDFKPAVLETYKRRFRHAVASYLAYLNDPGRVEASHRRAGRQRRRQRH